MNTEVNFTNIFFIKSDHYGDQKVVLMIFMHFSVLFPLLDMFIRVELIRKIRIIF